MGEFVYPEGAIQTSEELIQSTKNKRGVLHLVHNKNFNFKCNQSFITQFPFEETARVATPKNNTNLFFYATGIDIPTFALKDFNIDTFNDYNDHFAFVDEDKAIAYLEKAKRGWYQKPRRQP